LSRTLQFQREQSPSVGPKAAIVAWYVVCTAAAAALTLAGPMAAGQPGNPGRQAALLACAGVYIARAAHTLFEYVKRAIPWWEAAWGGSLIGFVLLFFLLGGLRRAQPLGWIDAGALLLYLVGSWVGTASEQARHVWKGRPENAGHLYTEGLFRHSRHVNYFADLLVFGGFGLLTRQPWTAVVPLAMAVNFALVIIPAHDAYLAERYGEEFEAYARRTRKLIPKLY
jgi:protein-S-isoprenylcysteine O-methyltransferase Ste14